MSGTVYLFDTSALLAHYRREAGWQEVQALFEDGQAEMFVASPSLTEFARRLMDLGVNESEANQTLDDYQSLMTEVVVIDSKVARAAVHIASHTPERLPLIDALIAAAAQIRNGILVHRDTHMAAIPAELLQQLHLAPAEKP